MMPRLIMTTLLSTSSRRMSGGEARDWRRPVNQKDTCRRPQISEKLARSVTAHKW